MLFCFSKITVTARCVIAVVVLFFFFSCGITEYYYLEPPLEGPPATGLTSEDIDRNRFDFTITNINTNGMLLGYLVYYKIYNSVTAAESAQNTIKNSNPLYSSQGMNMLKSLGYQQMLFSTAGTISDRIPRGPANMPQKVTIRLYVQAPFVDEITIDGIGSGFPERYKQATFQLLKLVGTGLLDDNFLPETDTDTLNTAGVGQAIWYVNAYAAAFGMTSQFSPIYSQLAPLGVVRIFKP